MSLGFEAFVARLYVDADARARFLADPRGEATRARLSSEEADALVRIDRPGLELAAASFAHKRGRASATPAARTGRVHALWTRLARLLCGLR